MDAPPQRRGIRVTNEGWAWLEARRSAAGHTSIGKWADALGRRATPCSALPSDTAILEWLGRQCKVMGSRVIFELDVPFGATFIESVQIAMQKEAQNEKTEQDELTYK